MFKMAKISKIQTPDWVLEGFESKSEYEKSKGINSSKKTISKPSNIKDKKESKPKKSSGKVFKIRVCPKCGSDNVGVVLTGEEGKGTGEWECKKCGWTGKNIGEKELDEDEFMKYLDEKGEEVA
jgi:transcription elongation factor Elf1